MSSCLNPKQIPDEYGHLRIVPCGTCNACLVRSRMEWSFRLRQERDQSACSYFVTLTYEDSEMPIQASLETSTGALVYDGAVDKRDAQLFMKRLRKQISPVRLRYYLVSEYGPTTFRPHYHFIAFLDKTLSLDQFDTVVRACWPSPVVSVALLNEERIKYVTEYCITRNSIPDRLNPNFRLVSRNPGIGAAYVTHMKDWHLRCHNPDKRFVVKDRTGYRANMPRYYREKIYDHDYLNQRAAELELKHFEEQQAILSAPELDRDKLLRDRAAQVADYNRRTDFFLNKKNKKI